MDAYTDEELLNQWDSEVDFNRRDLILEELEKRGLFPSDRISEWEKSTGAYPSVTDPEFLQKLLSKREFAESLQTSWEPDTDPCDTSSRFEVTSVQRFAANLMSPKTPYMSALLYYGVGVGKTCAGVQIAEAWLEMYPRQKVFLVAPPTIQAGFFKTIFDNEKVQIGEGSEPNRLIGCTGDSYLKMSGALMERDPARIKRLGAKLIKQRYAVFGYIQLANYIRDLFKKIPEKFKDERRKQEERKIINKEFSGKLLIIDEAHNLRDVSADTVVEDPAEEEEGPGGKEDKNDAAAGKLLTPYLRKLLEYSEGMKVVLLTATPMYNNYKEIIGILNILLMNDKKATISEDSVFNPDGTIKPEGERILSNVASRYVSFMRGENPRSFPIRLHPRISKDIEYPPVNPRGAPIPEQEKVFLKNLPIVPIPLEGEALKASQAFTGALKEGTGGVGTKELYSLIQAGNFIVPETEETRGEDLLSIKKRIDINGILSIFKKETSGEVRYKAKVEGGARWLGLDQLPEYSPKFAFLLNRLKSCEGVAFVYTRFVGGGALPIALALEANGYTPHPAWRKFKLLADGFQTPGGRQCAVCSKREHEHDEGEKEHFSPAFYGLLTGDAQLSNKNQTLILAEKANNNANGLKMKVIIGSQIASEGVDLKFIRESHIIDSWFHLNKTEQIVGRSIRFCSHSLLPVEKRNTTVYLYSTVFPDGSRETADLYSYRVSFKKAVQVGRVSRIMKKSAIDCNLNHDAILIQGQQPIMQIDAQGIKRESVSINDMPFTAICDWVETCDYKCEPEIKVDIATSDDSTYDAFSARWRMARMKDIIKERFSKQAFYRAEELWEMFADTPRLSVIDLFRDITDNKAFQIINNGKPGYIHYCNGYYVFQPIVYDDVSIPLSIRLAKYPVKRDYYGPAVIKPEDIFIGEEENIAEEEKIGISAVWNSIEEWINSMSESTVPVQVPNELIQYIDEISKGNVTTQAKLQQIIEMVSWFHISYIRSSKKDSSAFIHALCEFFMDNWFNMEQQRNMLYGKEVDISYLMDDYKYDYEDIKVYRFIDSKTGKMQYICDGNKECARSFVDYIERDEPGIDADKKMRINPVNTGGLYGFIVPKMDGMVFKTNEPPLEGKKLGVGAECGNVSTMGKHIPKLENLGIVLERNGYTNFDLTEVKMKIGPRKIVNAARACALMEIVLRYMDMARINNKRWFYRPVSAYYKGHKGRFVAGK